MKRRSFLATLLTLPVAGRVVFAEPTVKRGYTSLTEDCFAEEDEPAGEMLFGRVVGVVRTGPGGRERVHRVKVSLPARGGQAPIEVYATPVESFCGPISGRRVSQPLRFEPFSTVVVLAQNGEYFALGAPRYLLEER
jgi:hypothetical protein